MMSMDEFKEYLRENIRDYLPDTYENAEIRFESIAKNNDKKLDAMIISRDEVNISPTIYLEDFYKDYVNGRELRDIMHEISSMQQKFDLNQSVDISPLMDYEAIKEKIVPRLVNAEMNEENLKGRPYTMVEDLAVVYQVDMSRGDDGTVMSTAVHNKMFEGYGISVEELHETALANIETLMHPTLKSMREMLISTMPEGMDPDMLPPEDPTGMHILTCDTKSYGAASILHEKTMDEIAEKFGSFFILPSSIHEVIILPDDGSATVENLEGLVQEVNETQVEDQEVLSSHVYRYDKDTKEIYRADKEEEHLKKKLEKEEKKPSLKEKLSKNKEKADKTPHKNPDLSKKRQTAIS